MDIRQETKRIEEGMFGYFFRDIDHWNQLPSHIQGDSDRKNNLDWSYS